MTPEEYKNLVLGMSERNEDVKLLLELVYLLEDASSEEALTKNFTALRGEEKECRELLKLLRKKRVLGRGPNDEYIYPSGHEKSFADVAAGFLQEPHDLANYFEQAVKEGNNAAIKLIELLLKLSTHGIFGFTQYDLIKNDMSDMFSPAVFCSVEEEFIHENLCIYGKKRRREFLELYQSEERIEDTKERVRAWRAEKLAAMPSTEALEKGIEKLVEEAKRGARNRNAEFAEWSRFSEEEIAGIAGYFSGLTIDDSFLFLTGDLFVRGDTLHIVVTDSLSRYDVREWRHQPVLFITNELPKWIDKLEDVFTGAYPKLSEREVCIAVPNRVAHTNFKHELLYTVLERLGIGAVIEL